jgi:hypothetical protein
MDASSSSWYTSHLILSNSTANNFFLGFLDIEKLIEHRPPPDKFGFWKRPAIPQREFQLYILTTHCGLYTVLTPRQLH